MTGSGSNRIADVYEFWYGAQSAPGSWPGARPKHLVIKKNNNKKKTKTNAGLRLKLEEDTAPFF